MNRIKEHALAWCPTSVTAMSKDYWLSGIGLGTEVFRGVVTKYPLYTEGAIPPHSHNILLHIWIESGIIGVLSFGGWILHLFKTGINNIKEQTDKTLRYAVIAAMTQEPEKIRKALRDVAYYQKNNAKAYHFHRKKRLRNSA